MKHCITLSSVLLLAACGTDNATGTRTNRSNADTSAAMNGTQWTHFEQTVQGLIGKWESVQDSGRTVFNEQWERAGEHALNGIGYVMSGPDTVFVEYLALNWDTVPVYTVRSPSQNGNERVHFTWRKGCCDPGELTFDNPAHDWPQTIDYARTSTGWYAVVSGKEKDMEREARFDLVPRKDTLAME